MPSFEGQSLSIVFTGKQNPRILNHDFLLNNGVLPKNKEPFKGLFAKQDSDPFTDFLSTPVLACIRYAPINLLVEENRYQIRDDRFEDSTIESDYRDYQEVFWRAFAVHSSSIRWD